MVFLISFLAQFIVLSGVLGDEVWTLHLMDLNKFPNARCLDGSPGGFWYQPGSGSGVDKFVIHHQGGGWCIDENDCYYRSLEFLGSSKTWAPTANCTAGSQDQPCYYDGNRGIESPNAATNPVTYNWNKLYIGYCDGASYAGHVEEVVYAEASPTTPLHFKGRYILDAVYDTFLSDEIGMNRASEVIVSGTSAGGLAVYLHADYVHEKIVKASLLKTKPRVTAVPDAGFFMNLPSINGDYIYTPIYQNVFKFQKVSDSVNDACIAHYTKTTGETWKCFMAQYTLPFIQTPIFIANSFVDSWQGENIMGLTCDPKTTCTDTEITYMNNFRAQMLSNSSLAGFLLNPNAGAYLCECYVHPLVNYDQFWVDVKVQGNAMGSVFKNWYTHDHSGPWVVIDGEWGSDSQC